MSENKKFIFAILTVILVMTSLLLFKQYLLSKSKIAYGKYVSKDQVKGVEYYKCIFKLNGEEIDCKISKDKLKRYDLQDFDSIKIKYSISVPRVNECIDKRIIR